MKDSIRVLIADDAEGIRRFLRRVLEQEPNMIVVGEASNGVEAIELVKVSDPDVLILDIEMPVLNGIAVIEALIESKTNTKILVLSAHDDPFLIQTLLEIGASGYLTKDEITQGSRARERFIKIIWQIAHGARGIVGEKAAKKLFGNVKVFQKT